MPAPPWRSLRDHPTRHSRESPSQARANHEPAAPAGRRRLIAVVSVAGVAQAFVLVGLLHRRGDELGHAHEAAYIDPVAHWLRDSVLYAPAGVVVLLLATLLTRRLAHRWLHTTDGVGAAMLWAGLAAVMYAVVSVPAAMVHGALFSSTVVTPLLSAVQGSIVTLRYSFGLLIACAMLLGLPWARHRRGVRAPTTSRSPMSTPT